jgi:hypothetical protein
MRSAPGRTPPSAYLVKDAAALVGRSLTWIRQQRRFGPLVPAEIDGRQAVTAASLEALIARLAPPHMQLRLVVDNTK